jgi:hypothetical protein
MRVTPKGLTAAEFADSIDDEAERQRAGDKARARDRMMLEALLEEDLSGYELSAFGSMLKDLREFGKDNEGNWVGHRMLTDRQRRWVEETCVKAGLDTRLPEDRKPVPRGRDVPLAPVLRELPKRPPNRR